jgi:hypothetical protein
MMLAGPVSGPEDQNATSPGQPHPPKFRLKGVIGFGAGFDRIDTGRYQKILKFEDWSEVKIMPGGGLAAEFVVGYQMTPALALELGISYQSSGTSSDKGAREVTFQRYPLTLTLIHDFKSRRSAHLYVGGGAGYYFYSRYYDNMTESEIKITYKPTLGFHGLLGISSSTGKRGLIYFAELRFAGVMKYQWEKSSLNGEDSIPPETLDTLTGRGIYLNFGAGYVF